MLLVRGRRDRVIRWVRRGTLPVYVVPPAGHSAVPPPRPAARPRARRQASGRHLASGRGWTALVAAGPSRAMAPYRDGVAMLAAHPLRHDLRPAVGLFVDDGRAVVTCWPGRWRGGARWVVWTPGEGPGPVPGFPLARPTDLARAAGFARDQGAPGAIQDVLADPGGTAEEVLLDLAVLLGLPHAELVRGTSAADLPGAELVTPKDESVRRFDKVVSDEQRLDAEVEEGL